MNISPLTSDIAGMMKALQSKIAITAYIPIEPAQSPGKRTEFRTLLKTIKQDLVDQLDITRAEDLIAQLSVLGAAIAKDTRSGTVVLFSDGKEHHLYYVETELPLQITLDTTYDVEPLASVFAPEQGFFVLTLSKSGAKLFSGDEEGLHFVKLPEIQQGYKETLGLDESGKALNYHSEGGAEMFHGQDDLVDNEKKYLADYFRRIDKAISGIVGRGESPVVLAGVGYLVDLYRHVSKNKHLAANMIKGNMDRVSDQDLWQKAFPLAHALQM